MNPHLFVYGTLLSAAGHPMGARLRREARLIGAAIDPGRLYRIELVSGPRRRRRPRTRGCTARSMR